MDFTHKTLSLILTPVSAFDKFVAEYATLLWLFIQHTLTNTYAEFVAATFTVSVAVYPSGITISISAS